MTLKISRTTTNLNNMSITMRELNPKGVKLTSEMEKNIQVLFERMNSLRKLWAKPMRVTSGVRSIEDHKRIYREKQQKSGSTVLRIPMGSKHLSAQACDIADPDGSLMRWCKANVPTLEAVQLWVEDGTRGWVHFQTVPPVSQNRFFKP
jgi:uncharacterized protein YcbK (DUF882 family)